MQLNDDYALTTHEDENGAEWEIKILFTYQPFEGPDYEEGREVYPGCDASIQNIQVERLEPIYIGGINTGDESWVLFDGATEKEEADWAVEIMEAINQEFIDNMGEQ